LEAPKLTGGSKRITFETIASVERTLIPFCFRLFGASFYGGHYYIPRLGRAFMVVTNFRDGVLIRAKSGHYIITPSNPDDFIESIKTRAETKNMNHSGFSNRKHDICDTAQCNWATGNREHKGTELLG